MTTYWDKRSLKLSQKEFKDSRAYVEELRKFYDQELDKIKEKIYFHLLKTQDEQGGISLQDAKKLLSDDELAVFKRGLANFREKSKRTISPETQRELDLISRRVRISRLQAMEIELKKTVASLMTREEKGLFAHLGKTYESRYYQELYGLQRITGYRTIQAVSKNKLETLINTPWTSDGREFSARIWTRRDKLVLSLRDTLMKDLARGSNLDDAIKSIAKEFETSKANAARLVYTESAAISSKATFDSYKDAGLEYYQILATLDLKTSNICRDMDGKVFPMKDYKVGITAPPFHPNCRSTTVPYFDDEIQREIDQATGRMARDPVTGKSVNVGDLSYKEWYDKYVSSEEAANYRKYLFKVTDVKTVESLRNLSKSDIINIENHEDLKEYFRDKHDIKLINFDKNPIDDVKVTLAGIDDIISKFPKAKEGINRVYYNPKIKPYGITYEDGLIEIGKIGLSNYNTGLHEAVHALDMTITKAGQKSLSETVTRKAVKNLGMRINGKDTKKLAIKFIGTDIKELKNLDEWLPYALEAEYTNNSRKNKLTKEIVKVFEEELK